MRLAAAFVLLAACAGAAPPVKKGAIHVPVWIRAGQAAQKMVPGDMKVRVGGAPAQPSALLGPDDDLLLIVITDLAGDITLAETAKRAVSERIDQLPANDLVALMNAQDGLRVLVDATAEREPVKTALQALPVSGKAGLLETIAAAGALGDAILAKASVRLAVLYVTDSDVSNYREDFTNPTVNWSDSNDISRRFRDGLVRERVSKLDAALAGTETPMFIVHLAYRTDTLNQAYQTGLMTLASTTGGASHFCRSQSEISDTIGKVFDAIGSHYSLSIPLPPERRGLTEIVLESDGRTLAWRNRFSLPD